MNRSVLAPLFGQLLNMQQQTQQAVLTERWDWLAQLDEQLRECLQALAPYKSQLNTQQQAVLAQCAEQYRQQWQTVCQKTAELEQQLSDLRQQREGNLAYDWVAQLGEST